MKTAIDEHGLSHAVFFGESRKYLRMCFHRVEHASDRVVDGGVVTCFTCLSERQRLALLLGRV